MKTKQFAVRVEGVGSSISKEVRVTISEREARGQGYRYAAQRKGVQKLFGEGTRFEEYKGIAGHGRVCNGKPVTGHVIVWAYPVNAANGWVGCWKPEPKYHAR